MITKTKLQTLCDDCEKLLFYSERLDSKEGTEIYNCNVKIKEALRKIIIANEISDRMIVCITGLQGTGKTTLMKNYYGLEDGIMNIALGRGERLPVLMTESPDVRKVKMFSVGIKKEADKYSSDRHEISREDFIELSKGEDENTTVMYIEVLIPCERLSTNSKLSYMLLPGFERRDDYWNTLIEFSVECSDTAVFVLTPSKISDMENASLMGRIARKFGNNIIYVITHSDEKTDANRENKETLKELLKIEGEDELRIICAGAYADQEKNDAWKKQLQKAIERYSANPDFIDQKSLDYIDKILMNDLRPIVSKIKKYVTDNTDELLKTLEHSAWLDAFDKSVQSMRERLEKQLRSELDKALSEDDREIKKVLEKEPKLRYVKRQIFDNSLKDIETAKKSIDLAMKNQAGHYRYHDAFASAVAECTDTLCQGRLKNKENQPKLVDLKGNKFSTILEKKDDEEARRIMKDITTILSPEEKRENLVAADPMDIMEAIVECGTQYFGLAWIDQMCSKQYITVPELSKSNLKQADISSGVKSTEKFALSVLGITGLDLIGDGVINFVPALAKAMSIPMVAASVFTAGVLALGGGMALIKDYNKMQVSDYYSYHKVIANVYDEVKKVYLGYYDDYIKEIRRRVEKYLVHTMGDNQDMINKQNSLVAINNIKEDLDNICGELRKDKYELTKIIRG